MKATEYTTQRRARHHAALASLSTDPKADGLKIWRKLRRIEKAASDATTAQCNGCRYGSQPFRSYEEMDEFCDEIKTKVCLLLGQPVPGLFVNRDPRGYALKIDKERGIIPEGMETDWGGYGILAPEIN